MAYPANVFRVLIASPGDVAEEREIAVRAIQEWNDLNSHERQIVLLPLRWETHSSPEYGTRPQAVINRQVADHCDLVIGVFWTRIGTATGTSDSGTIEEIERAAESGKPVMLYFSQSKQDPDTIDIEQLGRLREFKRKTLPNSLIETYASHIEFKDKLSRQLEIRVRELLALSGATTSSLSITSPVTDIRLHFSDADTKSDGGEKVLLKTQYFKLLNLEALPDYAEKTPTKRGKKEASSENALFWKSSEPKTNKDYYRQSLTYRTLQLFFVPISFWLKNVGTIGARDVHVDLQIANASGGLTVIAKSQIPNTGPTKTERGFGLLTADSHVNDPAELISTTGNYWTTQFDVHALQPQREITLPIQFLIGATESCMVTIGATIFADTLPEPMRQLLQIELVVEVMEVNALDLLPKGDESDERSNSVGEHE